MDFDLSKKGGAKPNVEKNNTKEEIKQEKSEAAEKEYTKYKKTVYTTSDQERLLIGYDVVPPDAWLCLTPRTHIRYVTTNGEFRRGGFIHSVKAHNGAIIFVENGLDSRQPGYVKWPVAINKVETIWRKRTVEDVKLADAINTDTTNLENRIDRLETELDRTQVEMKKLIQVISRLNDKIVARK